MRGSIHYHLIFGLLLGTCGVGVAGARPTGEIVVRTYNYSQVSAATLARAKKQAADILAGAGITARWIDCATSPSGVSPASASETELVPSELVLNLIPENMAKRLNQPPAAFGVAVSGSNNTLGTAYVFVKRAEQLAYYGPFRGPLKASRAIVLGHLIAHEIGHLLLGPGSHAPSGIMSSPWSKRVLKRVGMGNLGFTRQEVKRIWVRLGVPAEHLALSRTPHP